MTGGGVWEEHSTGGKQKYQGPHVASRGRGRKTETGARGDAIIIDAAVYVGVRGGPQAGRSRWAGLGGAKGGRPTSHTPTDSLETSRGRRYKRILAPPGHKQTKGPCRPAWPATSPRIRTGAVSRAWKVGRCKWVPAHAALLDSVYTCS